MKPQCIVLDSGVFAKLFLDEGDREEVLALLQHVGKVVCPDIFLYEVLSIAGKNSVPMEQALEAIQSIEQSYLHIAPLTQHRAMRRSWLTA